MFVLILFDFCRFTSALIQHYMNCLQFFLYIIFSVLLKFERSLNSDFAHNNNNNYYYYYYYLQHLGFCYLFNIMASLYVRPQI